MSGRDVLLDRGRLPTGFGVGRVVMVNLVSCPPTSNRAATCLASEWGAKVWAMTTERPSRPGHRPRTARNGPVTQLVAVRRLSDCCDPEACSTYPSLIWPGERPLPPL